MDGTSSRPQPHAALLDSYAERCHVLVCGCQILAVDLFCYSIVAAMHRRVLLRVRPTFHLYRQGQPLF